MHSLAFDAHSVSVEHMPMLDGHSDHHAIKLCTTSRHGNAVTVKSVGSDVLVWVFGEDGLQSTSVHVVRMVPGDEVRWRPWVRSYRPDRVARTKPYKS